MKLILVGGFLGAGKTTLLWQAARCLTARGHAVGLVTNDQAPDLVDTAFLCRVGASIREVAGSCFCCNFAGFIGAVRTLAEQGADVVIAEPVGSCTDLSATIMQPVKDKYPEISLAPLSVLVDPTRLAEALHLEESLMHPSALYILRLQLAEADLILLNKSDTVSEAERSDMVKSLRGAFPKAEVCAISARVGDGVDGWLDAVMAEGLAGRRVVEVDYDRYTEGEAVLGWLNAVFEFCRVAGGPPWTRLVATLMGRMQQRVSQRGAEVGHLKVVLQAGGDQVLANLTALKGEVLVHGVENAGGDKATLIVNARVQMPPEDLERLVREAVGELDGEELRVTCQTLRSLSPGRPRPTYRYDAVVLLDM